MIEGNISRARGWEKDVLERRGVWQGSGTERSEKSSACPVPISLQENSRPFLFVDVVSFFSLSRTYIYLPLGTDLVARRKSRPAVRPYLRFAIIHTRRCNCLNEFRAASGDSIIAASPRFEDSRTRIIYVRPDDAD